MELKQIKGKVPGKFFEILKEEKIEELRPAQVKSIKKGLLERKNLLVCTPTASGKTLIAEMAALKSILDKKGKAIYIVPLIALANEKYKEFKKKYNFIKVAISIGDVDSSDPRLSDYDLIITTSEKMDSLMRHHAPWISDVATVIIDEIHMINDPKRGPTLEILMTMLRQIVKNAQIIGLSATIGNPEELAKWMNANLVIDNWRPVELHKGVYYDGKIEFDQ